jgi:hypothetical protein
MLFLSARTTARNVWLSLSHAIAAVFGAFALSTWWRATVRNPEVAVRIIESAATVARVAALRMGSRRWRCPGCGQLVDGRPTLPDKGEMN